ncbi:MAG: hypothetical protein WAS54_10380 [Scrofimicrobium sp.]
MTEKATRPNSSSDALRWIVVVATTLILPPTTTLIAGSGSVRLAQEAGRLQCTGLGTLTFIAAGFWFALLTALVTHSIARSSRPWAMALTAVVLSLIMWAAGAWLFANTFWPALTLVVVLTSVFVTLVLITAATATRSSAAK